MGLLIKQVCQGKVEFPSEMKETDYKQVIERIARFIDVTKWESRLSGFQIGFVSKNKKFMRIIDRTGGGEDLEIVRKPVQIKSNIREMESIYTMLINRNRQLYRVQLAVTVTLTNSKGHVSRLYDNQVQDICNLVALGYLKVQYPDIHTLFAKAMDAPSLLTIEDRLRDQIKFDMECSEDYGLSGCILARKNIAWSVPITDESKMLGDVFRFNKSVMMS